MLRALAGTSLPLGHCALSLYVLCSVCFETREPVIRFLYFERQ